MLDREAEERGSIVAELRRLRAKLAEVSDKDIKLALGQRIEALDRRLAELKAAGAVDGADGNAVADSGAMRAELEAELRRLNVKHAAVGDADMQLALGARIEDLKARLAKLATDPTSDVVDAPPAPPTPDEKEAADKLVQQARVEKMRGNAAGVANLLREASKIAPGSAEVLELLGDELVEQGKNDDAIITYDRARKLDPKNMSVDRKHAQLVFRAKAAGASALMSMADQEALASGSKQATLFSVFLPGLGQVVLTQYAKGAFLFGTWFSMMLWLFVAHAQLEGFLHYLAATLGMRAAHGGADFSFSIVVPLLVAPIVHAASIFGCKSAARETAFFATKAKVSHPAPPVNLPFE